MIKLIMIIKITMIMITITNNNKKLIYIVPFPEDTIIRCSFIKGHIKNCRGTNNCPMVSRELFKQRNSYLSGQPSSPY